MKEQILLQMKKEVEQIRRKINFHNDLIKRKKELEKDPKIKEYLELTKTLEDDFFKEDAHIRKTQRELITSVYRKHLFEIKETNQIYVYIGTFCRSTSMQEEDIRVKYSDQEADYRIYWNIEQPYAENIPIMKCEKFEEEHIILNSESYFRESLYYKIQREFFEFAVKQNQEVAKKKILEKYGKR